MAAGPVVVLNAVHAAACPSCAITLGVTANVYLFVRRLLRTTSAVRLLFLFLLFLELHSELFLMCFFDFRLI